MTKDQKKYLKLQVLNYVNDIRKGIKLPKLRYLPKGTQMSAKTCPIAKAINGVAFTDTGYPNETYRTSLDRIGGIHWPLFINKFIVEYDDGQFPELIKSNHE